MYFNAATWFAYRLQNIFLDPELETRYKFCRSSVSSQGCRFDQIPTLLGCGTRKLLSSMIALFIALYTSLPYLKIMLLAML
jgi:hypothetical protein